jgi:hypothetical protein
MPHTLRRIVVLALSMCALAVSGISPAAASVDLGRAKPIAAHHTSKKKVTVCDKAAQLRRAVIKKYVKLYSRQFGKKKGKAMGRDKPGRDICRIGLRGGKKPGSPRKVRYYWTLHRLRYPPPPPPEPVASSQPVSSQPTASAAPAGSAVISSSIRGHGRALVAAVHHVLLALTSSGVELVSSTNYVATSLGQSVAGTAQALRRSCAARAVEAPLPWVADNIPHLRGGGLQCPPLYGYFLY